MKYKCTFCNKDYFKKIDKELNKQFNITLKFFNNDTSKLICFC